MSQPLDRDEDGFEEDIRRRQRVKRVAAVGLVVLAVAGVVAAYLFLWKEAPRSRCDRKATEKLLASKKVPGERVYQVCHLPESLERTLKELQGAPPEHQRLFVFRMVAESPDLVASVCKEAPLAIKAALALPPAEQSERFLKDCDLRQTGLGFTRSALLQQPFHRLILAVAVFGALIGTDRKFALKAGNRILEIRD